MLFGRAVPARERDTVRRALADAGAEVPCVDALAPVVPLLVAQTEQALEAGRGDRRRLTGLTVTGSTALFEVVSAGRVRLTAHRIDRLSRARSRDLFDGLLAPGRHRVPLDARRSGGRRTSWRAPREPCWSRRPAPDRTLGARCPGQALISAV
ncbi:hypothetical protein [Streptomyces sp. NPDC102370]|uniref:hypothetical protein n=1 Tax=Streptomyces sp. NPDC102370 TaxID=3366163 RepID=UPI003804E8F8